MVDVLFLEYPKCSTCKEGERRGSMRTAWRMPTGIVEDNPTADGS